MSRLSLGSENQTLSWGRPETLVLRWDGQGPGGDGERMIARPAIIRATPMAKGTPPTTPTSNSPATRLPRAAGPCRTAL